MIIPGYLDGYEPPLRPSPLVGGAEVMSSPLFWPAFLYTVGGSSTAPAAFDADPGDLDAFVERLLHPDRWPVFSLPLARRNHLHIVMRNFADDAGVDYVLEPNTGDQSIELAALEGHFRGPALAWPELMAAAQHPDSDHTPAERLLLLLPAYGDSDTPATAVDVVAAALSSVGARSNEGQVSAELLDSRRYWTPCPWAATDGVLACLGPHSYRRVGGRLSSVELRVIADAFAHPGSARR
ncbi:hypothetical protein [Planotetraspora kaengkrachanensis]|uniref:Uncharacterized protein n=1 Tax=Planotetraspora kaengkrachanensis TaxID=575193 RepID=A0A8J3VCR0_9ACTN|nr:hypothetical protein [Planotetraspora kaengkrachanensis]GIG84988.1 hypothetical protein Pka01_81150 [Planotetraspora kaengkrachanensis]